MNTLKFFPQRIRKILVDNLRNLDLTVTSEKYYNNVFVASVVFTVIFSTVFYFTKTPMFYSILFFLGFHIFVFFRISLKASARIKKMEEVFPEVISLMASNLNSGMTIDRAFLLSARPEFYPLDREILRTGKDITTGQDVVYAMKKMSERIGSEKISKVILLIISGLRAGGNISDLLEETSANMKQKELLEKKSRSTILMYVIFIFFAVGVGAPVLFGLSSVLVQVIINLTSKIPEVSTTQMDMPFTFNQVSISVNFVVYFAVFFMIVSDLISSLVLGLVRKGDSKEGLKYFIPLVAMSLAIFFIVRTYLAQVLLRSLLES